MIIGPNNGDVTESIITFSDSFTISDVNATINLEHTYDGDLNITLVAPNDTEIELSSGNGGSGQNYTNTTFDDEASQAITNGTAPFTGSFQPQGNLSNLNGLNSNGDWKLVITDNADFDGGNLLNWSLQLCAEISLPEDDDFRVADLGNRQFLITLNTSTITERLDLEVHNILGQKLLWKTLEHDGLGYQYQLDMSFASTGVYLIRLGNNDNANTTKIIVK